MTRLPAPLTSALLVISLLAGCDGGGDSLTNPTPQQLADGKQIFRFDTFGDETFWTDTLRLHEGIETAVSPKTALAVGLKVDADALPPGTLETADLTAPATTVRCSSSTRSSDSSASSRRSMGRTGSPGSG
jgi:hypothetical protein